MKKKRKHTIRYSTEKPTQNEVRPGKAVVESVASSVDYTGTGRSVSDIAYLLSLCARFVSLGFAAYLIGVIFVSFYYLAKTWKCY